jgi:peptidoglycan/LPS O-acetylase OafA/YrhL
MKSKYDGGRSARGYLPTLDGWRTLSIAPVNLPGSKASVTLDLVRAIAAILVLLSHWRARFFVDYSHIPDHRAWFRLPYRITDLGHQSVLIFFVLSGYLISGSILRSLRNGQWHWRTYLTHRLVRLWIVLIPGILLGGLWDWIGMHHSPAPALYLGGLRPDDVDLRLTLTLPTLFGNLLFLQTLLVPTFGSNGALWSLANEFWYYILCPLGWLALRRGTPFSRRLAYLALLFPLMWFLRASILRLFPIWLDGTILALLPTLRLTRLTRIAAAVVYVPLVLAFAGLRTGHTYREDFVFGLVTTLFFWIMLSATEHATGSLTTRLARQGARFSFTLYIVHMPALVLLTSLCIGTSVYSPTDLRHLAMALAVLLLVIAYAWLIASLTEFRTDRVRAWVERHLNLSSKTPSRRKKDTLVGAGR